MDRGLPRKQGEGRSQAGAFHRRLALIFGLHLLGVIVCVMLGVYNVAPLVAVVVLLAIISALAWLAARRQWRPVGRLARVIDSWDDEPDVDALAPTHLSDQADADLVTL